MPFIYNQVSNYKGPYAAINTAPRESRLRCRKIDLYRSIITVGNPSFLTWKSIRKFGLARALYDSILEKVGIVAVNIDSNRNGIRRHPIFDGYVSDKKRIVSYNLGMAFAKLYSEKLLNIPNLVHIEFLKKQRAVAFVPQPGNSRPKEPDLVGQTADGNWHLFEAKGVSHSESQLTGKIDEAKEQVQQVDTIHGVPPATGSACATYIGKDRIFSLLEDPPSGESKQLEFNIEKFFDAYYAPFWLAEKSLDLPRRKERIDGLDVDFFELVRANRRLRIGLASEVAELVRTRRYDFSLDLTQMLRTFSSVDVPQGRFSVGSDGFVVGYIGH